MKHSSVPRLILKYPINWENKVNSTLLALLRYREKFGLPWSPHAIFHELAASQYGTSFSTPHPKILTE